MECCEHVVGIATSQDLAAVQVDLTKHPDRYADVPHHKRPNMHFTPTDDVKNMLIDPQGSGTKTVTISATLSDK